MSRLRVVSVVDPARSGPCGAERLALLGDADVTVLAPVHLQHSGGGGGARQIGMEVVGSGRAARYPLLGPALTLLDPAVVHVQADPGSAVVADAARLCGSRPGRGLLLEVERGGVTAEWRDRNVLAAWRARRSLPRASAAIARSSGGLALLRRHGFRGAGFVAGAGEAPPPRPDRNEARRALGVRENDGPVLAWVGPPPPSAALCAVLEALAVCEREMVLAIPDDGGTAHDAGDRADALDVLHRVRFVLPDGTGPGLRAYPSVLAAADAILCAPSGTGRHEAAHRDAIALAQGCALPVVCADTPELREIAGPGAWTIPCDDFAALTRLLDRLAADPGLLRAGAQAAAAQAAARHAPEAAAATLELALGAARRRSDQVRAGGILEPLRDLVSGLGRELGPS